MEKQYKAFLFSHTALKSICSGVQNAHALSEMFVKYKSKSIENEILYEWAERHKTIIMRDGGITANLDKIHSILYHLCPAHKIPYASFRESNEYMDGLLTSVGFILDRSVEVDCTLLSGKSVDQLYEIVMTTASLHKEVAYAILVALIDATRPAQ